jgi:hypothetical protein
MAMSGLPMMADCMLMISSGAEVPKATIVSPTTRGERCSRRAILEEPFTKKSPPTISMTRPIMRRIMVVSIGLIFSFQHITGFAHGLADSSRVVKNVVNEAI